MFGKDQKEHDANLVAVLNRLRDKGATLNLDKCSFSQPQVKFYGHIFSDKGLQADPKKVENIKMTPPPKNVSEVKSFLGMTQYLSRYIPDYATITAPLRNLTHLTSKWKWKDPEQKAFQALKDALASDNVMTFFSPERETQIVVDASPVGLGAMLCQEGKVISYASCVLKDPETRYL